MYRLVEWDSTLDLADFYAKATAKGYENNASQRLLVDCFDKEKEKQVWILYYNDRAVGSVGAHSLDMWPNSYRICARTCVFTDMLPIKQLRSLNFTIKQHQNITAQFFIPRCIEWAPDGADLYITSNKSTVASQRLVHDIYCPALAESNVLEKSHVVEYRGHEQTFWKLNVEKFYEQLDELPRWK